MVDNDANLKTKKSLDSLESSSPQPSNCPTDKPKNDVSPGRSRMLCSKKIGGVVVYGIYDDLTCTHTDCLAQAFSCEECEGFVAHMKTEFWYLALLMIRLRLILMS